MNPPLEALDEAAWCLEQVEPVGGPIFLLGHGKTATLGRGHEADWHCRHPELSRLHCRFGWDASGVWVEDAASKRGVTVNGERVTQRTPLAVDDLVQIGPLLFRVAGETDPFQDPEQPFLAAGYMEYNGVRTRHVPLAGVLRFGRGEECDVRLHGNTISRLQFTIRSSDRGWLIDDAGGHHGTRLNRQRFTSAILTVGDLVETDGYRLRFDGESLRMVRTAEDAVLLAARDLTVTSENKAALLNQVSFDLRAGELVLVLGASGSGKSTLLETLAGMRKPSAGRVAAVTDRRGFVPQDDIVHRELKVQTALQMSGRLRLGPRTPADELDRAVHRAMGILGIEHRSALPVGKLSGGQRKRVSVASEILVRPPLLLLDEPAAGLDPAAEMRLMQWLRQLADTGCAILCATHVPANFHLANRVIVLDAGRLVFAGSPEEARTHFGVAELAELYEKLGNPTHPTPPSHNQKLTPELPSPTEPGSGTARNRWGCLNQSTLLFIRQALIFRGDWRQAFLLLLPPLAVGFLAGWVGRSESLSLFVAWLAAFWFGCNNSAQEFVRERPIFERERRVGLRIDAYWLVRFLWMSACTIAQVALLMAVLRLFTPVWEGHGGWQWLAVTASAMVGVATGLAVSAWAAKPVHALVVVPLIMIPQILLAGYVTPAHEMRPEVRSVAQLFPSYAAARLMDVSIVWGRPATRDLLTDHWHAVGNIRLMTGLRTGETLGDLRVAAPMLAVLTTWLLLAAILAALGLTRRSRSA